MPSTATHAFFAMDVFEQMPIKAKEIIQYDKEDLKIFSQSMDALFFYSIHTPYKGKRIRQFGHYFHQNKTQDFFINLIEYIKYNKLMNDSKVMTFLYGMLCHYIADSTIHPYIIYKCGNDRILHDQGELFIDHYMIGLKSKKKHWKYDVHKEIFHNVLFTNNLKEIINYTFKETFDINNMSKFYEKAIKEMSFFYKTYRRDHTGIKLMGYSLLDFITREKFFKFKLLSYHYNRKNSDKWLNLDNKVWYNPLNKRNKQTSSFMDLYRGSIKSTVNLIKDINNYLYYDKDIDLKKLFPNISYVSGLDCKKGLSFKHFES